MAANNSCPATGRTQILGFVEGRTPVSYHIVCMAPYTPGPVGDNITRVLRGCCNDTVQVVTDDTTETGSNCISYCNATLYDGREPESGNTFWKVQECTWTSSGYGPNGTTRNPYGILCYPKGWGGLSLKSGGSGVGSMMPGAPQLGLGLFVMLVFGIIFS
ncbi:hypothetical protein GE09DRAFT_1235585 [Coniochaeta sp. 2T2.1]|nr:hypothetical protein GE09DRAFT_1235585 [Coniochaeta sp. 2T2.1]